MPRKYYRTSTRATSYTQEALETAIHRIRKKELSYAAASRIYGIPTSTLNDRVLQKTAIKSKTLGRSTAIPRNLETKLANCLRTLEKWGWGLSREEVLDIAQEFVIKNKLVTPFKYGRPGSDWFISFRQRHNLSVKKPQPVEYLRKKMTDPFIIQEYFTLLEKTFQELNIIDPNRIWNLDETSICLDPTKTKVVGAKGEPCTRTTCGSAKENITVLTTVNAAGKKLDPLIVFKGKHMYEQWMSENTDKYDFKLTYAASKRGWMETEIFYNYMSNVIIPNLGEERPVVLLYDGHVTHVDDKVVALAVENDITIVKLPAHTSHLLQPLDLSVFKSFKTIWDKKLVKWQRKNIGIKLRKQCFAKMFADAWQETKPEIIRNGFRKGGIYPFNANIIPKEKFDPKAYARWQKHVHQVTFKQVKALKQLCLDKINNIMYNNSASSLNMTNSETTNSTAINSKESPLQKINISFEELLLEKVTQQPQNKTAIKLKRVAKGGEVITKSYVEKHQEIELKKKRDKEEQKITKQKQKRVTPSKTFVADPAQPGPSGIKKKMFKKVKNTTIAPILTDNTNKERYITKKGKGIGKKTRTDKENIISLSQDLTLLNDPITNPIPKEKGKKRKRTPSISTTVESIQMSVHSDSDLQDCFSDSILTDCDIWNTIDPEIQEEIFKTEKQFQTLGEVPTEIEEDNIQRYNDMNEINICEKAKKVVILSSVKLKPENQAFYIPHGCSQLKPIDKDWDIFTDQKWKKSQNTDIDRIPKNNNDNFHTQIEKSEDDQDDDDVTEWKTYNIGDTVLVRYYKKTWKYYVGVIENIDTNAKQYSITYYKTIGKKQEVKFVIPKRKDQDSVPDNSIVKEIELLQIKEDPAEYILMNDEDAIYF